MVMTIARGGELIESGRRHVIPKERYVSREFFDLEMERLWPRVWQIACREEEIPEVGDYVTYDIVEESIIVARVAPDRIAAYYNACRHRGRRLTDGCGHVRRFVCPFHGWKWNLAGENIDVLARDQWEGTLTDEYLRLRQVKVDRWGGFVFINMDPDCEPLADYLGTVIPMLDPFEIDRMRYRWRQWLYFPCNWKVAIEAFIEGYHVPGTHPQLTKHSAPGTWSKAHGRHSCFGAASDKGTGGGTSGASGALDMRVALAEVLTQLWDEVNATTTRTIVDAAQRLADELPPETPPREVQIHLMKRAMEMDAARGVVWPKIDPQHIAEAGNDWHVFPNSVLLQGPTFLLGYRARPHGRDPDSCIFEVFVMDRFPEGQEPKPENLYKPDHDEASWRKVLCQDFSNMEDIQRGMKSRGFSGARPNPFQERAITNFHRVLAEYMGRGAPRPVS